MEKPRRIMRKVVSYFVIFSFALSNIAQAVPVKYSAVKQTTLRQPATAVAITPAADMPVDLPGVKTSPANSKGDSQKPTFSVRNTLIATLITALTFSGISCSDKKEDSSAVRPSTKHTVAPPTKHTVTPSTMQAEEIIDITDEKLDQLIENINHPSLPVRMSAVESIIRIGPKAKKAVPALIKVLEDKNSELKTLAILAFEKIGLATVRAVPKLKQLSENDPSEAVRECAKVVFQTLEMQASVVVALENSDPGARTLAVFEFGAMKARAESILPKLKQLSENDPSKNVRDSTKVAIELIESDLNVSLDEIDQRLNQLMKLLNHDSIFVQMYALNAIAEPKFPPYDDNSIAFAKKAYPKLLLKSLEATQLNLNGTKEDVNPWVKLSILEATGITASKIGESNGMMVLVGLGEMRDRNLKLLTEQLNRPDGFVRLFAVRTITGMGPRVKEIVLALIDVLEDRSRDDRTAVIYALGRIGMAAESALPKLKELSKNDPDKNVREAAKDIIKNITTVCTLVERLKDGSWENRLLAAFALARIGLVAEGALPRLIWLSRNDPSTPVREIAKISISVIETSLYQLWEGMEKEQVWEKMCVINDVTWQPLSPEEAKKVVPALIKTLEDRDPRVRRFAVMALGRRGALAESALPKLKELSKNDPDKIVRDTSDNAIYVIEKMPLLIKELEDKGTGDRTLDIISNFARWGYWSEIALPKLKELSKNAPSEAVREAAKKAIRSIEAAIDERRQGMDNALKQLREDLIQGVEKKKQQSLQGESKQQSMVTPFAIPLFGFISGLKDKFKSLNYQYTEAAKNSREPKVVVFDQTVLGRSLDLGLALRNMKSQLGNTRFYTSLVLLDQPITQQKAQEMLAQLGLNGLFDVVLTYDLIGDIYHESYDADTILTHIKAELRQGTIKDENFIILASQEKLDSVWRNKIGKVLTMLFSPLDEDHDLHLLSIALAGAIEILANNGQLDPEVQKELNNSIQQIREGKFEILPTRIDNEEYHQRLREYRDIIIQA